MTDGARPEPSDGKSAHFTPREHQIVGLVSEGLADKEIAARLGLSTATVRTYLERVFKRHDIRSRTAAVRIWMGTEQSR